MEHPLHTLLAAEPFAIIDGGLATELEKLGCDLNHRLWSARVLKEQPDLVRRVHRSYLEAGADVIISASYQATVPGFLAEGVGEGEALALIRGSVTLAIEARHAFLDAQHPPSPRPPDARDAASGRHRPLVAGSVGPYGACLADGSEYRGGYGLDETALADFHRPRIAALLEAGADLLACETVPCLVEARALVRVLSEFPDARAWISFSARDAAHISDGTPFAECVRALRDCPRFLALGVNCTAPRYVTGLMRIARAETCLPLLAYPNAGEEFDAASGTWRSGRSGTTGEFARLAADWLDAGARLIGGCCRTGPAETAALAALRASRRTGGNTVTRGRPP